MSRERDFMENGFEVNRQTMTEVSVIISSNGR